MANAKSLLICVFTLLLPSLFSFDIDHYSSFLTFVKKYNKKYAVDSEEFWHRYDIFKKNLKLLEDIQLLYKNETVYYGVNKFSDISQEEFEKTYLNGLSHSVSKISPEPQVHIPSWKLHKSSRPNHVDWRNKSIISAVKNQESCGACWAFTVTETIESMYAKTTHEAVPNLAVQEVIDCAIGSSGCEGGDTCAALDWMVKFNKTIQYEKDYPLVDETQTCKLGNGSVEGVRVKTFTCENYVKNEDTMLDLLSTVGPLSVTVDASTWKNYIGGIIKFHCPAYNNHAVQIVGYDLTGDVPYYIVRNSWGTDFGDNGYLYIKVGENLCGLATRVSTVEVDV